MKIGVLNIRFWILTLALPSHPPPHTRHPVRGKTWVKKRWYEASKYVPGCYGKEVGPSSQISNMRMPRELMSRGWSSGSLLVLSPDGSISRLLRLCGFSAVVWCHILHWKTPCISMCNVRWIQVIFAAMRLSPRRSLSFSGCTITKHISTGYVHVLSCCISKLHRKRDSARWSLLHLEILLGDSCFPSLQNLCFGSSFFSFF